MFLKDGQASIEPRLAQRSQAREEIRRTPMAMARHRDANVLVENMARAPPLQLASFNEVIQAMRRKCHYLRKRIRIKEINYWQLNAIQTI